MFWSRRQSVVEQHVRVIMKKKSLVSPSFLKQKARQLKREKSLSQSQALDETAKLFGFSNYKNYLNILEDNSEQSGPSLEGLLKKIISEKDISKKVALATSFIQTFEASFQDLLEVLKLFQHSENAVQSVCEKSKLKDDVNKSLLNYFLESKNEIQLLPLKEHFVAKDVSVKNLTYALKGDEIYVSGDYDLEFEFEFEVPDEDKHLPHFNREPMFGEFEVWIDKNRKMTVGNPTIGENIDGSFYMVSFKIPGLTRESYKESDSIF